ncbi:hypothetical protein BLNAU_24313 [Blattamonas nauphoetae]|uniref:Uncharacterized protein n=1 Tax=Blattamonas nauphoetae TaxID=2049346 RepID=A0ABQ9WMT1_9EUKA|nr:hypothetical protein BLNAU_24313 [Blattamonas nauphoetae]
MIQTTLSQSPPPDSPNYQAQIRTGIASDESEPEDDDQGRNEAEPIASEEKGEGKEEEKDDNEARQEEETTRDVEYSAHSLAHTARRRRRSMTSTFSCKETSSQTTSPSPVLPNAMLCSITLLISSFTQTQKQIQLIPFIHSRSTHDLGHTSLTLIPRPSALNLFVQSVGISSLAQIVLILTSLSGPDQFDANIIQSALSPDLSIVSALSMTRSSALAWYPAAVALTSIANLIPPQPAKILEATLPSPSIFESTFVLQAASTLLNTSHVTVLLSSRKSSQLRTALSSD